MNGQQQIYTLQRDILELYMFITHYMKKRQNAKVIP